MTSLILADLLTEAGVPTGVVNVVCGRVPRPAATWCSTPTSRTSPSPDRSRPGGW
ncbi:hypothetical protein ACU4GR_01635 [Methylobacterium oryzae CBMB20]